MQSKTLSSDFFNRTLFVKNRKRFWPLWVSYSFILLWFLSAMTFLSLHLQFFGVSNEHMWHSTIQFIYHDALRSCFPIAAIFSMFMALAVFSYLGNERSCYYFHSLPLTRSQLLSNGFISGLGMMFIPNLVFYMFTNLICWSDGLNAIKALSFWLLLITFEELFFFSLAALCMIIFGHNIASPLMYVILIFYSELMALLLNGLYQNLFYGSSDNLVSIPENNPLGIISPLRFFNSFNFYADEKLAEANVFECYKPYGFWMVIITSLVVTAVFIAAAVLLYNRRKSEHAGDVVAIDFMKPVFRWVFGISFAILFTTMITETLMSSINYTTKILISTFVLLVIFGVISFIAAEMIIRKSFRVFKGMGRRFWTYTAFIVAVSFGLLFAGDRVTKYVPDNSDVKELRITASNFSYAFTDRNDIDRLMKSHRSIIADKDELVTMLNVSGTMRLDYEYTYENGKTTERNYFIPTDCSVAKDLYSFFVENAVCLIFGDPDTTKYSSCELCLLDRNQYYDYRDFYSEQTGTIVKALIKDYESGYITLEEMCPDFAGIYIYKDYPDSGYYRLELHRSPYIERDYLYDHHVLFFDKYCVNTMEYLRKYVNFEDYQ